MDAFLNYIFWGNTVRNWLIAVGCILLLFAVIRILKRTFIKKVCQLASRTTGAFDDLVVTLLEKVGIPLLYLISVYAGIQFLTLSPRVDRIVDRALVVVFTWAVIRVIISFGAFGFKRHIQHQPTETREKQGKGILIIFNILVWIIGLVFLIDNFGYNITTIITGLGVGGIAIALAAQTILGDLFSYLVIFFDKPFEIGDFIIIDNKMGTVEYIGIKTTRIRTLDGEQLVASNSNLTNAWLHNYKRMSTRRIVFSFGIDYQTPAAKVKQVSAIVRRIIEAQQRVKFDRAHFLKFGDSSLDFEAVYIVQDADFNIYMDIQQSINLALIEELEKEGIRFAHPTRTLFMPQLQSANENGSSRTITIGKE